LTGPSLTLVLGGARSGKSAFAQARAEATRGACVYLATARAGDAEMAARIAAHRRQRGPRWRTVEEPLALAAALRREAGADRIVLVDCLTLWLSNLLAAGADMAVERDGLVAACGELPGPVILVSNEVGQGIVPDNALARRFIDEAGWLHQQLARVAGEVFFLTAGLPQRLK
jgi:adenosylcobinamide kinase/adenosylcobinamide-phosphate guanylyltransferase